MKVTNRTANPIVTPCGVFLPIGVATEAPNLDTTHIVIAGLISCGGLVVDGGAEREGEPDPKPRRKRAHSEHTATEE